MQNSRENFQMVSNINPSYIETKIKRGVVYDFTFRAYDYYGIPASKKTFKIGFNTLLIPPEYWSNGDVYLYNNMIIKI